MCLAIPMRITATDGAAATIEADGLVQKTSLMLVPDARVGDYVLVHAGFAIAVLESDDAAERLALFEEIAGMAAGDEPGSNTDGAAGQALRPLHPDEYARRRAGRRPRRRPAPPDARRAHLHGGLRHPHHGRLTLRPA